MRRTRTALIAALNLHLSSDKGFQMITRLPFALFQSWMLFQAVFASGQVCLQITGRLFSPARPGQCETDLGFVGQASWVPGGGGRLSVYSM